MKYKNELDNEDSAKNELILKLGNNEIKCAKIYKFDWDGGLKKRYFVLRPDHTEKELKDFFCSLEFGYKSGHGGQQHFGLVWTKCGKILKRNSYDGSEWWEYAETRQFDEYNFD